MTIVQFIRIGVYISYRGVEQLVACRAHNPKVAWFESRLRNHVTPEVRKLTSGAFLLFPIVVFVQSKSDTRVEQIKDGWK
jgi:hypothetical protein